MDDLSTDRLAELAVSFGANVQPGQVLIVNAELGREQVARAIAAAGYRAGARHVEVVYTDAFARRARIEHGGDEAIGFAPSWQLDRLSALGDEHVALITLEAALDPAATDGLDPARLGADQSPVRAAYLQLVIERLINWCIMRLPDARVGGQGLSRAAARCGDAAAVPAARPHLPAGRRRPGGGLAASASTGCPRWRPASPSGASTPIRFTARAPI